MSELNPDEVLLKPKSKDPKDVFDRAVSPLIPIWKFGKNKTIQPYVKFRDLNCGDGNPRPAVEAGIKITF